MGAVQSWWHSYDYDVLSLDSPWSGRILKPVPLDKLVIIDNQIVMSNYYFYQGNILSDFAARSCSMLVILRIIFIIAIKITK